MSSSRGESQHAVYGRKRSNTATSLLRNPPIIPLKVGDSIILQLWITEDSPSVVLNQNKWPGVVEGDIIRVTNPGSDEGDHHGFLFKVPKDETASKPQLQISAPKTIASIFKFRNFGDVSLTKVDPAVCTADYVEFNFQDQYLGRNDMWRMGEFLAGKCVFVGQEILFIGAISIVVRSIYIKGNKVSSAYITSSTKAVYRSLSAKFTIFIQVCRELWDFAGDGERYNEKIVHSFLPALFSKWREAGTNHIVAIILMSRVFYDQTEIEYAAGPLRCDEGGKWYKDFFKVVTDLEFVSDWKPTLVSLKESFWTFQRDILLTHHHHQAQLASSGTAPPGLVRLVGRLSYAHEGPLLEALNLGLNPNEMHYVDRTLSLTGASTIVITPGTGYYRVNKHLLRLTTIRILDQGFGLDLISLAKPPLHQSPIFSFMGLDPELKQPPDDGMKDPTKEAESSDFQGGYSAMGWGGGKFMDPLWGGDDDPDDPVARNKVRFWWEPFWTTISFWDKQMDLPFRQDRFIARAQMHEIQMMGLLEHDILSSIEVPYLPYETANQNPTATPRPSISATTEAVIKKADARKFDNDVFAPKSGTKSYPATRNSIASVSSGSGTLPSSSYREKRSSGSSHRTSMLSLRIEEEGANRSSPELYSRVSSSSSTLVRRSPSPMSASIRSAGSTNTADSISRPLKGSRESSVSRPPPSKFAPPSWLLKPFRSQPSQPMLQHESASTTVQPSSTPISLPQTQPAKATPIPAATPKQNSLNIARSATPKPMAIKHTPTSRSALSRLAQDDDAPISSSRSPHRRSPMNTPPTRDEATFGLRRSVTLTSLNISSATVTPYRVNPSKPRSSISYSQAALSRRWEHMFPTPPYVHEIKWKSLVSPGCLPLTVERFPSAKELLKTFDVSSWFFVIEQLRSFLIKTPGPMQGTPNEKRRAWALLVMREMAAVRLAQGFQFVLRPSGTHNVEEKDLYRTRTFVADEDITPKPLGVADVLNSADDVAYLSMTNEIHRISYAGEAIECRRYVRRLPLNRSFDYQCLIWPKLGVGYTELSTQFSAQGLENYGWNGLDMVIAGFEHRFNESLRYWRTRFIVIPTDEPPLVTVSPTGEKLNEEEARLLGMDKLAETFTRMRWQHPEERILPPPVRFLPTTKGPSMCILDDHLIDQLDDMHESGPLRKKMRSEREIGDMSLSTIAKVMREDEGVPIKNNQWHHAQYENSFTGFEFVSWLVREFRDVSTRSQGAEWGEKLLKQGLFEHCRGQHGFLDGHYYYRLKGEYAVPSTSRGWFNRSRKEAEENGRSGKSSSMTRKKRLILSQSMILDIDPNKRSDQAENVVLSHDIVHNPANAFHFELQWIGTTARCIEDQLRQWRSIERYGLRLVEAYVTQISDIRDNNPFQSCFPIHLAFPPPIVPDLERRIPEGIQAQEYFEAALLRKFGFVLDVEGCKLYPESVDVVYSYRRSPYTYSQYVHRSGVAFVQILGGEKGYLFLNNRLMGPGKMGNSIKNKERYQPSLIADSVRASLGAFCRDKEELKKFWDDELALLISLPED